MSISSYPESIKTLFSPPTVSERILSRQARVSIVHGGPGTGKTRLLVQLAVERIKQSGIFPVILVANQQLVRYTSRLFHQEIFFANINFAQTTTNVKTPHALAYSIIDMAARYYELPHPKVLTAREQDDIICELLRGHYINGGSYWPSEILPALTTRGFTSLLRDFLLRAGENGLNSRKIIELGKKYTKPLWIAAGKFAQEYEEINALQAIVSPVDSEFCIPTMTTSDLFDYAMQILLKSAVIREKVIERFGTIFVDDAHAYSPQLGQLIHMLSEGISEVIFTVNPEQKIYSWRGASEEIWYLFPQSVQYTVHENYRLPKNIAYIANSISHRSIAGTTQHRGIADIMKYPCRSIQIIEIIRYLTSLHIEYGIAYHHIAVIVRNNSEDKKALIHKLILNAIPYNDELSDENFSDKQGYSHTYLLQSMLDILIYISGQKHDAISELSSLSDAILLGPFIGVHEYDLELYQVLMPHSRPDDINQLKNENLIIDTSDNTNLLNSSLLEPSLVKRINIFTDIYYLSRQRNLPISRIISKIWDNFPDVLNVHDIDKNSQTVGSFAQLVIKEREIITEFFQRSYDFQQRATGKLEVDIPFFIDELSNLPISSYTKLNFNGITITSAHASMGRQWKAVVIMGVQEGMWPNYGLRQDLLNSQEFIYLSQQEHTIEADNLHIYTINMQEERALFHTAITRSSDYLLITAVESDAVSVEQEPSIFFQECYRAITSYRQDYVSEKNNDYQEVAYFSPAECIPELRKALIDDDPKIRDYASTALAYLIQSSIPAANPKNWYGVQKISSTTPFYDSPGPIVLSPSTLQMILDCPISWFFSQFIFTKDIRAVQGSIIHLAAQALVGGISTKQIINILSPLRDKVVQGPLWYRDNQFTKIMQIIAKMEKFFSARASTYELIAVENSHTVQIGEINVDDREYSVIMRGRIDRIEREKSTGKRILMDIKTSKTPINKKDANSNVQLLAYRKFIDSDQECEALLYYPAVDSVGHTIREQTSVTTDAIQNTCDDNWLLELAQHIIGPVLYTTVADEKHQCRYAMLCPAHRLEKILD